MRGHHRCDWSLRPRSRCRIAGRLRKLHPRANSVRDRAPSSDLRAIRCRRPIACCFPEHRGNPVAHVLLTFSILAERPVLTGATLRGLSALLSKAAQLVLHVRDTARHSRRAHHQAEPARCISPLSRATSASPPRVFAIQRSRPVTPRTPAADSLLQRPLSLRSDTRRKPQPCHHSSEQHWHHPTRVDADHAVIIDFDAHALELPLGPPSSALSLADEPVQLGNVVSV